MEKERIEQLLSLYLSRKIGDDVLFLEAFKTQFSQLSADGQMELLRRMQVETRLFCEADLTQKSLARAA